MTPLYRISAAILLSLSANAVYAYGSGQSSSSCDKPVFSEFQPATNKYTQSLSEFSFVTSSNTTPASINVNVSAGANKYHFSSKELQITPQKNGHLEVKGKLDRPIEHGFVRISITAHIKPGCDKTDGYLVRIQ
jgi:uncharacterized alpha/beta hydrolase family protein